MTVFAYIDNKGFVIELVTDPTPIQQDLTSSKLIRRGVYDLVLAPTGFNYPKWNFNNLSWEEIGILVGDDLEQYKNSRIEEIDFKTNELLLLGFNFDGKTFSLSSKAQLNWTGIQTAITSGMLTESNFPFQIITLDDNIYMLQWEDVATFMSLVLMTINTRLSSGRSIKQQIKDANTKVEVDSIIDNR